MKERSDASRRMQGAHLRCRAHCNHSTRYSCPPLAATRNSISCPDLVLRCLSQHSSPGIIVNSIRV